MVLAVLCVSCAALMGVATNGIVVGVAIALWLGAKDGLRVYREPKRPTALLENASSAQLSEMLTVTRSRTVV